MKLSIVIPVYYNQGSIHPSFHSIKKQILKEFPDINYEFIFVNDGSKDKSLEELLTLKEKFNDHVKVISFSKNFGQFAALNAGLTYATGDYIITISADQQEPPTLITDLLKCALAGKDIVLAVRADREDSFIQNITAKIHVSLIRISTKDYPIGGFDCWLLNRKALKAYKSYQDVIRSNQIDILNLGFKVGQIHYKRLPRLIGKSQYNFSKRLKVSLNQILTTSSWPLKLVTLLGFFFTIAGFSYGLLIIKSYFQGGTPFKGYAPIVLLQLIIGGIIMLMLGVIGEYQWRIYYETKKRPLYIIDDFFE